MIKLNNRIIKENSKKSTSKKQFKLPFELYKFAKKHQIPLKHINSRTAKLRVEIARIIYIMAKENKDWRIIDGALIGFAKALGYEITESRELIVINDKYDLGIKNYEELFEILDNQIEALRKYDWFEVSNHDVTNIKYGKTIVRAGNFNILETKPEVLKHPSSASLPKPLPRLLLLNTYQYYNEFFKEVNRKYYPCRKLGYLRLQKYDEKSKKLQNIIDTTIKSIESEGMKGKARVCWFGKRKLSSGYRMVLGDTVIMEIVKTLIKIRTDFTFELISKKRESYANMMINSAIDLHSKFEKRLSYRHDSYLLKNKIEKPKMTKEMEIYNYALINGSLSASIKYKMEEKDIEKLIKTLKKPRKAL